MRGSTAPVPDQAHDAMPARRRVRPPIAEPAQAASPAAAPGSRCSARPQGPGWTIRRVRARSKRSRTRSRSEPAIRAGHRGRGRAWMRWERRPGRASSRDPSGSLPKSRPPCQSRRRQSRPPGQSQPRQSRHCQSRHRQTRHGCRRRPCRRWRGVRLPGAAPRPGARCRAGSRIRRRQGCRQSDR